MAVKPVRTSKAAFLAIARGDAAGLADYLMFGGEPDLHVIRRIAQMLNPDLMGGRHVEHLSDDGELTIVSREQVRSPERWRLEFKAIRRPGNQPAGSGTALAKIRMAQLVFERLFRSVAAGEPDRVEIEAGPAHGAMKQAYHDVVDTLAAEGTVVALDTVKKAYAEYRDRLIARALSAGDNSTR